MILNPQSFTTSCNETSAKLNSYMPVNLLWWARIKHGFPFHNLSIVYLVNFIWTDLSNDKENFTFESKVNDKKLITNYKFFHLPLPVQYQLSPAAVQFLFHQASFIWMGSAQTILRERLNMNFTYIPVFPKY